MNHDSSEPLAALAGVHARSIPLFARSVVTPDVELDAKMREQTLIRALSKLTREEAEIVVAELTQRAKSQMSERERKILQFLQKFAVYALVPKPCAVKVMGAAYVLDLPINLGLPMASMARRMGVTRASLSNAAWQFARENNLEPSRWMRSEESSQASRKAREKFVSNKQHKEHA